MKLSLICAIFIAFLAQQAAAQTSLYVFRDERKEHLKAARKERLAALEKAVQNDFHIRIRPLTSESTARMEIAMKKAYETEILISDMDGNQLATLHKGQLEEGKHEFYFQPEGSLRKPFVCQLLIDGKTEAMKVVKFNAF